jgi:hypothetical protein
MKIAIFALLIIFLPIFNIFAGSTPDSALILSHRLFKSMMVKESFIALGTQTINKWLESQKHSKTDTNSKVMDNLFLQEFENALRADTVLESMCSQLYSQQFTVNELKDMISFYNTPAGIKLATSKLKLDSESNEIFKKWYEIFTKNVLNQLKTRMK